jgi:hypothetical protein
MRLEPPKVLAPVDVEALREAMSTVVEQVEKDDPAPLRRRIAELERQLAAKPAPAAPVEVPALNDKQYATLIEVEQQLLNCTLALRELQAKVGQPAMPFKGHELAAKLGAARKPVSNGSSGGYAVPIPDHVPTGSLFVPVMKLRTDDEVDVGGVKLKKGAREMVRELVALAPRSLTRRELATRALLDATSGSTGRYLRDLAGAELIENDANGNWRATAKATKLVGAATPRGAPALQALWQAKFKKGAREMLEILVRAPATGFTREQLAGAVRLDVTSGSTGRYLRNLTKSGCAEKRGKAYFAGPALFIGEQS